MKIHKISFLAILVSLLFISFVFAQDNSQENNVQPASKEILVPQSPDTTQPSSEPVASNGTVVPQSQDTAQLPSEPETQWIWGEVASVDPVSKSISIKYLDYETDQEKEMVVSADEKTTYENIKTIDGIKPKDTLSVDYIAGVDGKNIAKNVSLEKPESAPAAAPQEAPSEQVTPENMQQQAPAAGSGQQ